MRSVFFTALFFLSFILNAQSQPTCTGSGRYIDSLFECVDISPDIQFGTGIKDWGFGNLFCLDLTLPPYNTLLPLRLDLYEPCGDTLAARPLVIAIHGGAWAAGDKSEMAEFADYMAKKGYVVASINYRLSIPENPLCWESEVDSIKFFRAAMRGIQDSKAAVRYFKANAGVFRIDPDYIFVVGGSAGAFNALGTGYLNWEAERPGASGPQPQYGEWLGNLLLPDMGSIEGNGGNPDETSSVRAVVSLSGAVTDTVFFEGPGDPPLLAFHGDADDVVPYGYDCALQGLIDQGIFNKCIRVFGPAAFVPAAQAKGVDASLITFPGGGHGYTQPELDIIFEEIPSFLCEQMWSSVAAMEPMTGESLVTVFPNPVSGQVTLSAASHLAGQVWNLYDLNGRLVFQALLSDEALTLDLTALLPGLYIWSVPGGGTGKIVKN